MNYVSNYNSILGDITLLADDIGLKGLWFKGSKYYPDDIVNSAVKKENIFLSDSRTWLDIYFKGSIPDFTPKLNIEATKFQLEVYEILLKIPYGSIMTYGEIAKLIAKNRKISYMGSRAVGSAVGHNPISIIVPCHRVLGKNSKLTGYSSGLDKKIKLLDIEKIKYQSN